MLAADVLCFIDEDVGVSSAKTYRKVISPDATPPFGTWRSSISKRG
jgi:hypothetical protein